MVLVEDVTENSSNTNQSSSNANGQQSSNTGARANNDISNFIMQDKISALIFLTRVSTILFSILFIIPITSYEHSSLYQKALLSSAATSALKLHQRMTGTPFQLNRVYFAQLMIEDSFHYLLYSLIFLNNFPITIVLMPISGFALLHVASYIKTIINLNGSLDSFGLIRKAVNTVCAKDKDVMRFVAVNEIIIVPTIFIMIFTGKSGIFVPFIYYRFICLRYQSRRNPYNRIMFYELKLALEYYTNQPGCPQMVRNLTQRFIGIVARMAPVQTTA